jgi:Uma2 family endonuclease
MPRSTMTTPQELREQLLAPYPEQGEWSEERYLAYTDDCRGLIEFTDGCVEVLPMPTDDHQLISQRLFLALLQYLQPLGGLIQYAPLRLRIRPGMFREPDLLLVKNAKDSRRQNRYWTGADLVVEVVSPDKPERDTVEKRRDYAEGNIPEYWIVNPEAESITVLKLADGAYVEHGVFVRGETATSATLPGFSANVSDLLDGASV